MSRSCWQPAKSSDARNASRELEEIARVWYGRASRDCGAGECGGEAGRRRRAGRLGQLRGAVDTWRRIDAPYAVARARLLIGLACRALGDEDSATLEFDAARQAFKRLGAKPDLARVDAVSNGDAFG